MDRKKILEQEIEVAQRALYHNINQIDFGHYLPDPLHLLNGVSTQLLADPLDSIVKLDTIVRNTFPKRSSIRSIFKYLSLAATGVKYFQTQTT